ncbi:MAG: glycine betaine ABC transporter substrate-binding protein, partial [Bacillota bacterium]
YPDYPILKAVNADLMEWAPEVVEFLDGMMVGTDNLNEITAYMEIEDRDAEEGAMWFFENKEETWRSWLSDDVAESVAEALRDEGVSLSE